MRRLPGLRSGLCLEKPLGGQSFGILPRTTDGKYAAKKADFIAYEQIETIYGGPKTIVDNWK